MATITITTQILSGNLGDGWSDNFEAAKGLAEFTEKTWREDLVELETAGHEIVVDIDVERASGCSRDMSVNVDGEDDFDTAYALEQKVERMLTDESRMWDLFCGSEAAEDYASDEYDD